MMSDAPETIWAWGWPCDTVMAGQWQDLPCDHQKYRRADLPATDAQAFANENVKALVGVLEYLDRAGGLGLGKHKLIRAALEAIASPSIAAMEKNDE